MCVRLYVSVLGARENTHITHQTPTCTPIILDGLAVKCVMWGRSVYVFVVSVCMRARPTNTQHTYLTHTPNTYPYTGHTARLLVQVGE